ncbi:uncharacterized small membrane protein [Belliella baltica DSM 15883]|uniref:Uncharacterized small membrane protein n=1 Tax=Belliella baltica (strain DSM 15883 / CIP 108006 / LMG 21964 / BA134) TaxID=866536 RepID=I3Z6J6_BELBD|nr:DUF423 domain-containing protein [Belliella baltica]AFL84864.1 uncharacterized small membrane protein [Belliella baltica DSM 15883]
MNIHIKIAAILGALAVGIGAFGAHSLAGILAEYGRTETFETAVKYHFYHALAIALIGVLKIQFPNNKKLNFSGYFFLAGIIIFSGSLYVMSLTGITWLGAITPFGGLAFILGWIYLFLSSRSVKITS